MGIDFRKHYPSTMPRGDVYEGDWVCSEDAEDWPCSFMSALLARAALADELAHDAAIGRAVRRLPVHKDIDLTIIEDGGVISWHINIGHQYHGIGPDLPSAIDAALAKLEASRVK